MKLRTHSQADECQFSRSLATAISPPSAIAIA
jgi:hypothetical protein